jgi:hypothetical protein
VQGQALHKYQVQGGAGKEVEGAKNCLSGDKIVEFAVPHHSARNTSPIERWLWCCLALMPAVHFASCRSLCIFSIALPRKKQQTCQLLLRGSLTAYPWLERSQGPTPTAATLALEGTRPRNRPPANHAKTLLGHHWMRFEFPYYQVALGCLAPLHLHMASTTTWQPRAADPAHFTCKFTLQGSSQPAHRPSTCGSYLLCCDRPPIHGHHLEHRAELLLISHPIRHLQMHDMRQERVRSDALQWMHSQHSAQS